MSESPDATGRDAPGAAASGTERQPVVRVRGARRARLLAAPGTTAEPAPADDPVRGTGPRPTASGPNDERMMRDVPPHY
ncbi:hypothetical protein J2X55_003143 [Microbacterium sp. 1154]|uniref:hypothetical protein n=1 Tax=Microbacterium sp. 1154 TaxID=2817733 RepID=UPI00285A5056|nr:hypothetical protein [Microbacterium sp. 1154]MDR6692201.1 hypothetical protein [Microbacterium sp. 1154]